MFSQCLSMMSISSTCSQARNLLRVGIKHHGFLAKSDDGARRCKAVFLNVNNFSCRHKSSESRIPRHVESEPCTQLTTAGKLFTTVTKKCFDNNNKVSIVGIDEVGIATVFALITQNVTNNICMIDLDEDMLRGELIDLQLGSLFHNARIISSKDPAATADSKICIVITGTYKGKQEHPNIYVGRNVGIIRALIPPLVKYSPASIFVIASDPVDILSYVTWKLSGIPKYRVIGTGTLLDTARFRYLLSQKMGISPEYCHGYIIGEHGKNSVPVWSSVNIAGVPLIDINPNIGTNADTENWAELYNEVVNCDDTVRTLKGYSAWSIALSIANLCQAILTNSNKVLTVSTHALGEHSIKDDVFLSLPCVVGEAGVTDVVRQKLSEAEYTQLRFCAENIASLQDPVKILS